MLRRCLPLLALFVIALAGSTVPEAPWSSQKIDSGDVAWLLSASGLVLLMTPGLSFFYGGMVRPKNVLSTMFQSLISMGLVSVLWVVAGFSLCFGESWHGLIGNPLSHLFLRGVGGPPNEAFAATIPFALFALFQMKFAIITPALITGAFAERFKFSAYLLFITLFSIFIYAPVAHWTWHPSGWLHRWGVLDFAGGTVVHMTAGWAALAGALVLGPRQHNGHHTVTSIPYIILGTGLLWFGWFGFNAGSSLAANATAVEAFINTNTAAASAMLGWLAFDHILKRKPSAMNACIAGVVGLVAITPAAGYVSMSSSILIGLIASVVSNWAVQVKSRVRIDDTLDVFPCHGVGGMVGMFLTGVLARDGGLITGSTKLFFYQTAALVLVSVYSFVGSWVLYKVTGFFIPLRVSREAESQGLDLALHGEELRVIGS